MEKAAFSTVKMFRLVEQKIKQINTFPLRPDNFNIQHDAFNRLINQDSEEQQLEPFAWLEMARKAKDTDLRFRAQFYGSVFMIEIENTGVLQMLYADLGETNEKIAQHIVAALTMLSNGQLLCALTTFRGQVCAYEYVYRQTPTAPPETLSFQTKYPRTLGLNDSHHYEVHVFKNQFPIPDTTMPKRFFLRARMDDGSPTPIDRQFEGNTITPLTKAKYKVIKNTIGNARLGAQTDAQSSEKLSRSWLVWLLFIVFCLPTFFWVPARLIVFVIPFTGIAAFVAAYFAASRYLIMIEFLRQTKPGHFLVKIEDQLTIRSASTFFYRVGLSLTLVTLTFPLYITKTGHEVVTLLQLARTISPLVLLPAAGLVTAFIFALSNNLRPKVRSGLVCIFSITGMLIVNFGLTYTGEDVATPQPQTAVAILVYFAQLIVSAVMLANLAKPRYRELTRSA